MNATQAGQRLLVCVTPYVPYPGIDHAGGEFLRQYLEVARANEWEVRLIAPNTRENVRAVGHHRQGDVSLYAVSTRLPARMWHLLASGIPVVSGERWMRRLPPTAMDWLREATVIDLQWADALWNAPALRRRLPHARLVGLAHDVRTESLGRAVRHGGIKPRLGALTAFVGARTREPVSCNALDVLHVFKHGDRRRLTQAGVRTRIELLPVPLLKSSTMPRPDPTGSRLLFVATFRRSENVEAAEWFLDRVLPVIRRGWPGVKVRLAGSSPPARLMERRDAMVEVTGYVEDLATAYEGVSCVVVPLRRGAGVKFKTVEALEAGFPVVATSVGAEGVEDAIGLSPAFQADESGEFGEAVLKVLKDPRASIHALERQRAVRNAPAPFERRIADALERAAGVR